MKIGPYAIEQDYSYYVAYVAKSILAVVGTATKGPINEPTLINSPSELTAKFGPVNPNCFGLYAGHYFLHQADKLWFVRAATDSATEATVNIAGTSNSTPVTDIIKLKSVEKSSYYNGFKVIITVNPDDTFSLVIKDKSAAQTTLESHKNLSLNTFEDSFVSKYLKVVSVTLAEGATSKVTADTYTLADGNDGITDITSADFIEALNTLDTSNIDMNLLAIPGISDESVVQAGLTLCESRGDTLYIVDPPKGLDADGVQQWHNGEGTYSHTKFNSSYGALYYDWQVIYDSINKVNVEVPPSVVVGATIAQSDRMTEPWFAPAGLRRGLVKNVIRSVSNPDKKKTEMLYSDDNNINSIVIDPQVGLCVFGQKTLWRSPTALNRVNVRRLLNYLKRVIVAACTYLTFEPNDRITWNYFEDMVEPVLKSVKNKRGLYDYRIVKGETIVTDEDIDNYRMPCQILLKPTKAAEEIPIYFTITRTGAEFDEILGTSEYIETTSV